MKWTSVLALALLGSSRCDTAAGQGPALTPAAFEKWPVIFDEQISNDGQWVLYTISGGKMSDSLVVKGTDRKWQLVLPAADDAAASCDSRDLLYLREGKLRIYDIGSNRWMLEADSILSFKCPSAGKSGCIAWMDQRQQVVLYDTRRHAQKVYPHASDYQWCASGDVLLIRQDSGGGLEKLLCVAMSGQRTVAIPVRAGVSDIAMDDSGGQLAFIGPEAAGPKPMLWYCRPGVDSPAVATSGLAGKYDLAAGGLHFSSDGRKLYFRIRATAVSSPAALPGLHLWRYSDEYLPTEMGSQVNRDRTYTCVITPGEDHIIQLDEEGNESLPMLTNNRYAIVRSPSNYFGGKWRSSNIPSFYLKDLHTGEKRWLLTQREVSVNLSPSEKYAIWYDPVQGVYFVHETATGITKNITPAFGVSLLQRDQPGRSKGFLPYGVAGWRDHDSKVLLYDQFDLWEVNIRDLSAVNLTNGYGRKNKIILRIWNARDDYATPDLTKNEVVLVGFDMQHKDNGFFKQRLTAKSDPVPQIFGGKLYYDHKRFSLQFLKSGDVVKAANAEAYLLREEDCGEYPNLYFTRDLRRLEPLSDLHPEKDYNWMTSELISWPSGNGEMAQGILYKPADFDPRKKYPVLFYFYERLSHRLHEYLVPERSVGSINIPLYVSNGYLVVTPDIQYQEARAGEGALNAVVAAAHYISSLPYADSMRMGIQGHSFGGYEVNYIVSHSNMFAAAQESAGASDFISYYNGLYRGSSAQFYFEYGQGRVEGTLWEKPDAFVANSPIFHADKVQTPLLIMHNKDDGEVPFQQGVEWFTGLRRLGKKVWMLQYNEEHHVLDRPENQLDFSMRVQQFFDHYLKGAAAPEWMK